MGNLNPLQQRLGYTFQDRSLLELAVTHPSISHDTVRPTPHNQRLEFLGDSVLGLVLTAELYRKFPQLGEGPLSKARAHLVNGRALAEQGRRLNLGEHLILSPGEETSGGRTRASALADAFEAVVGAIFLDGGIEAATAFVLRCFGEAFVDLKTVPNVENPKGELQELLQMESVEPPQYQLSAVSGPDHDRMFECTVLHRGVELGRGQGKSKKEAEMEAALGALQQVRTRKSTG